MTPYEFLDLMIKIYAIVVLVQIRDAMKKEG
jgi:hypothetical protein